MMPQALAGAAPLPGSGVAATLCAYLKSAHVLTSTKQLQDQYASDFAFPVVKGRSNFKCLVPTRTGAFLQCDKGRCRADWKLNDCPHFLTFEEYDEHRRKQCGRESRCEHLKDGALCLYYEQKWSGFETPSTVYNYPFFLSELKHVGDIPHRTLLVCDEVHDLERQLVGFASFTLKKSAVSFFHERARYGAKLSIPDMGKDEPTAWLDVLLSLKEELEEFLSSDFNDVEQGKYTACREMFEEIQSFTDDLKVTPTNWVVSSLKTDGPGSVEEVGFQPILVKGYASPLFGMADSVLLMSATVFSKEKLCEILGIEGSEACFIQVSESSFPVENRRIHVLNTAQLNQASMEASLGSVAQAISRIMEEYSGERGIIHTTSYRQTNYIIGHVSEPNRRRLVTTEGSSDRSGLLRTHGATTASVLISPSLFQGVDLKDQLSRFQVIVKVPYPDLSDARTQILLKRDRAWYDWQTALRLVQTYGRSVRSETDHADTYVLDSNFTSFLGMHRNLFPAYFLEALV
jgi:ATP-dependent DNA helicase DinG